MRLLAQTKRKQRAWSQPSRPVILTALVAVFAIVLVLILVTPSVVSTKKQTEGDWVITQGVYSNLLVTITNGVVFHKNTGAALIEYELLSRDKVKYTILRGNRTFVAGLGWDSGTKNMVWFNAENYHVNILFSRPQSNTNSSAGKSAVGYFVVATLFLALTVLRMYRKKMPIATDGTEPSSANNELHSLPKSKPNHWESLLNFFRRVENGDRGLARTFWIAGVVVPWSIAALVSDPLDPKWIIELLMVSVGGFSYLLERPFDGAYIIVMFPYFLFALSSIRNAAAKYEGPRIWKWLVFIWLVLQCGFLTVSVLKLLGYE